MRIAYLVSRFPHVSETFVVREMNAVAAAGDFDLRVLSLFPAVTPVVHASAEPWVATHRRAGARDAAAALLWWLSRRPWRLLSSLVRVGWAGRRRPEIALRSLVAAVLGAAHARRLARDGTDHVHAHFASYPATAAWMVRRLAGIPYSFTAHAHDIFVDQTLLDRKLADCTFAVAISEYNRSFLGERNPSGRPVHVVRCGVPLDRGPRPPGSPADGALCVASLQEYKGHRVLLDALAAPAGPHTRELAVTLVGEGVLAGSLRARVEELGLGSRVRFTGGLTEGEVAELLRTAGVFVLPSIVAADGQMEGVPVALMEAMAAGVPVVTTRLSGIPELVRDGETGLLAEPGDAAGLAAALERTLADPDGTADRTGAARRLVEAEFELSKEGERLAALFAATLSSRSG